MGWSGWQLPQKPDDGSKKLEDRLWVAADLLRANSKLLPSEYSNPVLGLIFLKFADHRFKEATTHLESRSVSNRRSIGESDYHSLGVMYLPKGVKWDDLLSLPEGANLGNEISNAMGIIEDYNEDLKGVLPRNYSSIENKTLVELMRLFDNIPFEIERDLFGRIFEYFLGNFAMAEGQGGGMFYTPASVVKLMVEILEPHQGTILDPACGSGGMFVQSARFIDNHNRSSNDISVYGMEAIGQTANLAKMNLAVHQMSGQIKVANSYYEDPFESPGKFDFVMANPPFNVDKIDKDRIKSNTARYPLGMPKADNGNFIWVQMFYSALNEKGKAGFVMPPAASDARHSEQYIRRELIESRVVDVMVSLGTNLFYTVTMASTLWFIDKSKKATQRADKVLFIDARQIWRKIDRAHRDFSDKQIEFISNIVRMYRGLNIISEHGSDEVLQDIFGGDKYNDVKGLCKIATITEIEEQNWSLSPSRYVGSSQIVEMDLEFSEKLKQMNEKLKSLDTESEKLTKTIARNISSMLGD